MWITDLMSYLKGLVTVDVPGLGLTSLNPRCGRGGWGGGGNGSGVCRGVYTGLSTGLALLAALIVAL